MQDKVDEAIIQLSKEITQLPLNHEELEIVIADKIKRFYHESMVDLYRNLEAIAESKGSGVLSRNFGKLKKSHFIVSKSWKYGTKYSFGYKGEENENEEKIQSDEI